MFLLEEIEDHRADANKYYQLADIIFLVISGVLCCANDRKAIEIF
ncbi:MAG: transposase family protein, partial [Alteromonadales bacterium]|nr:transposase family protein [Alteromonadales bacterium]